MKSFLSNLKRQFARSSNGTKAPPPFDLEAELRQIRHAETSRQIEKGKLIHQFSYGGLELRLDRDILGMYRITVNEGQHRLYSFTVVDEGRDYEMLRSCYGEIIRFLAGNRALADLPSHTHLKGYYYGTGVEE